MIILSTKKVVLVSSHFCSLFFYFIRFNYKILYFEGQRYTVILLNKETCFNLICKATPMVKNEINQIDKTVQFITFYIFKCHLILPAYYFHHFAWLIIN